MTLFVGHVTLLVGRVTLFVNDVTLFVGHVTPYVTLFLHRVTVHVTPAAYAVEGGGWGWRAAAMAETRATPDARGWGVLSRSCRMPVVQPRPT
ncbi:MAG: hypothetical protein JOY61_10935 [Chloroflexi bacterium]|nr:hypothetical protein [Chloroflexota bacterium]